jgi:hypothetical protein
MPNEDTVNTIVNIVECKAPDGKNTNLYKLTSCKKCGNTKNVAFISTKPSKGNN